VQAIDGLVRDFGGKEHQILLSYLCDCDIYRPHSYQGRVIEGGEGGGTRENGKRKDSTLDLLDARKYSPPAPAILIPQMSENYANPELRSLCG